MNQIKNEKWNFCIRSKALNFEFYLEVNTKFPKILD